MKKVKKPAIKIAGFFDCLVMKIHSTSKSDSRISLLRISSTSLNIF